MNPDELVKKAAESLEWSLDQAEKTAQWRKSVNDRLESIEEKLDKIMKRFLIK